ncbi:MAG: hypothetical protein PVH92_07355 [Anaerolineales bacterium]|jgi:hypothetical protein
MSGEYTQLESAESASPVITRLLASYLVGEKASVFEFATWEKVGLQLLNHLPLVLARQAVRHRFKASAFDPEDAKNVSTDDLVKARIKDYTEIKGKQFPLVILGAALGGASAHLAAVLGSPFLPQPFILGLRGGSPDDELNAHLELTSRVARAVLDRNPDLMGIAHFDPIHDGWLTRVVSHLRFKLIDLHDAYKRFIREILQPGGMLLYLDSQARWLQYELGERHRYQVGGWGGIPPREFLEGSERIDAALERAGSSHRGGWSIPYKTPKEMPESEWGSEPGLIAALQAFALEEGFRFERIVGLDPHAFSVLAYAAHEKLYNLQGREPQGVVIETFTQYDPALILRGGLLPLWLIFNTTDSLAFLKSRLHDFGRELPVYFSGLVTLSRTPDMVPWEQWAQALSGFEMRSIGARAQRYPEDLVSLWQWSERLQAQLAADQWCDSPGVLDGNILLQIAYSLGMLS